MFIDYTYFFEPLAVAQLEFVVPGSPPVYPTRLSLQSFINVREPELLKKLLGYELYKAFIAGVQEVVVNERWTNLLYGAEYTNKAGKLSLWRGLIPYTDGVTVGTYTPADRFYKIDGPGAHDPASGQTELRDPFLKDKQYRVIERGTGPLQVDTDYTLVNDPGGFDNAENFESGGIYTVEFTAPVPLPAPSVITPVSAKQSLIANYVFFWYSRNAATKTTGSGEKIAEAKNATNYTSAQKQVSAWNDMVYQVCDCIDFLLSNGNVYPEFSIDNVDRNILHTTNLQGI